MLKRLREWNETRKKNNSRFQIEGAKQIGKLIDKYSPLLPPKTRARILSEFALKTRAYHDFKSFVLAAETPHTHAVNAALAGGAALFWTLGAPIASAAFVGGLGVRLAQHVAGYTRMEGGTLPFTGRTVINANSKDAKVTVRHEATHFLSRKMARMMAMNVSSARREGLADYITILEEGGSKAGLKPPAGTLGKRSIKALWSDKIGALGRIRDIADSYTRANEFCGQYLHYIGGKLSELAGKDVNHNLAKELMWGRDLREAVWLVGVHNGVSKKALGDFIAEHRPAKA